jgi:hypothetical protein
MLRSAYPVQLSYSISMARTRRTRQTHLPVLSIDDNPIRVTRRNSNTTTPAQAAWPLAHRHVTVGGVYNNFAINDAQIVW